jgi:hypothetical protein
MEFTLTYRGPLPASKGTPQDKRRIREYLHPQLKELWEHAPLKGKHNLLTTEQIYENENIAIIEPKKGFNFVALVSDKLGLAAHLHITFLRHGPLGKLISNGGDLDNRLKALFDGLASPDENQIAQAPPSIKAPENIFCLLSDDSLIHSFTVAADRLLDVTRVHADHWLQNPTHPELEVLLLIRVETRTTELKIWNMDL